MTYSQPTGAPFVGVTQLPVSDGAYDVSTNGDLASQHRLDPVSHPDDEQIELYILRSELLEQGDRELVERHLESCDECRRVAGELLKYYVHLEDVEVSASGHLERFIDELSKEDGSEED